jgi:hypothetical protein
VTTVDRRAHLVGRTLVQRIVLGLHRAPRAGEDCRCVALGHEAARAHGAAGGEQVIGALGPQAVGLGEVTREVAQVERVRDGGELVHDRLGLGCGDGLGHRLGVERVADHRPPAQLANQLLLGLAAGHARDLVSALDQAGKQLPAKCTRRSCEEDPHGHLLSGLFHAETRWPPAL